MAKNPFVFERGEPDVNVRVARDLTARYGEAGEGVYGFVPNPRMRRHFTGQGEALLRLHCSTSAKIVDFTDGSARRDLIDYMRMVFSDRARECPDLPAPRVTERNYHRFGASIQVYVAKELGAVDGYIVDHGGPQLPEGKQVVLRPASIARIEILKPHMHAVEAVASPRRSRGELGQDMRPA